MASLIDASIFCRNRVIKLNSWIIFDTYNKAKEFVWFNAIISKESITDKILLLLRSSYIETL